MAKSIYTQQFQEKTSVGGIATGSIEVFNDGTISSFDGFCCFFALKAQNKNGLIGSKLIQSSKLSGLDMECFDSSSAVRRFPFSEISFSDKAFPAEIKSTVFSPFIPLNDTDSGIPAAVFEIEVTNTSSENIDFSLCFAASCQSKDAVNKMGCTDTGEAYILLSQKDGCPNNICLSTDSKNVSFFDHISSCHEFTELFTAGNDKFCGTASQNNASAICSHFNLDGGKSQKIIFCLGWYFPFFEIDGAVSKNYYSQYFESSIEASSYIFRHMDRLKKSSLDFCDNIFCATLSDETKNEICNDLYKLYDKDLHRLYDGKLIYDCKSEPFYSIDSFIKRPSALCNLFPCLEYSYLEYIFKNKLDTLTDSSSLALIILKRYRNYIFSGNVNRLIEDWYCIVKCMEVLFGEDCKEKPSIPDYLEKAVFFAVYQMAQAVKDKKRCVLYGDLAKDSADSHDIKANLCGYQLLCENLGFCYNAPDLHIGFNPIHDIGDFSCFFCTPTGYGYIELGLDYIEINMLEGFLTLRSAAVPRKPRLVQYGGRNWKFTENDMTVILDSELEITPSKKLTILIDII